MVNIPYMRNVRAKLPDERPNPLARVRRINRVRSLADLRNETVVGLEINVRNKMPFVLTRFTASVRHGKQRHLVTLLPHHSHQFEQINFSSAERKVVFVAIQNSHSSSSQICP